MKFAKLGGRQRLRRIKCQRCGEEFNSRISKLCTRCNKAAKNHKVVAKKQRLPYYLRAD